MPKKRRLKDFNSHTENPFLIGLSNVPTGQMKKRIGRKQLFDEKGTPVKFEKSLYQIISYDKDSYTKVFQRNVKEFYNLKDSSFKVFFYITQALKPKKIVVNLYKDECCKEIGISTATFYRALVELIENDFIAKSTRDHIFFINPNLFFNGDRMAFIKIYQPKV